MHALILLILRFVIMSANMSFFSDRARGVFMTQQQRRSVRDGLTLGPVAHSPEMRDPPSSSISKVWVERIKVD
jgi:hypothetical protein